MLRYSLFKASQVSVARRFIQTSTKEVAKETESAFPHDPSVAAAQLDPALKVVPQGHYSQAPNREATWSRSQVSREEVYQKNVRFVGVDLAKQPQGEAAIELTAQQPVHFVKGDIAVCNGTDRFQGHPKVYINLDKPGVAHCGYCGAKYAKAELEGKL